MSLHHRGFILCSLWDCWLVVVLVHTQNWFNKNGGGGGHVYTNIAFQFYNSASTTP